ncbi:hypothetical protein ACMA1I_10415 [Pontibacter sp. 13R65]|uniref:hypothetical protein n=1 Tax=Pontibacter sp. 13R65 TaxID=3127458 RepID=UPI00301BEAE3
MQTLVNFIPLVEKEQIPSYHFDQNDVLTDKEAKKRRMWDLNRASWLGNAYHGKVEITFKTADGEVKRVDTTVWAVDDRFISFKAGCAIPTSAIISIEFF